MRISDWSSDVCSSDLSWTFDGEVPGPLVRVTQGDTVEFTLINSKDNKNSHSIDFHASQLDVVENFGQIKPGETKQFTFTAKYPGIFFYHCGSDPMIQHIARGIDRKSTRLNSSH